MNLDLNVNSRNSELESNCEENQSLYGNGCFFHGRPLVSLVYQAELYLDPASLNEILKRQICIENNGEFSPDDYFRAIQRQSSSEFQFQQRKLVLIKSCFLNMPSRVDPIRLIVF